MISIVIPAHNEEKNIKILSKKILSLFSERGIDGEIIIVNDNSTDKTRKISEELAKKHRSIKVVNRLDGLMGVGRTLRAGFRVARGDVIVTMDCDLSHDPLEIPKLLNEVHEGFDVVIGSRYVKGGRADMPWQRTIISRFYNRAVELFLRIDVKDLTTGFRAFKKRVLNEIDLESGGFEIHPEMHIKAWKAGFRVTEVPIHYHKRAKGKTKLSYLKVGPGYLKVLFKQLFA